MQPTEKVIYPNDVAFSPLLVATRLDANPASVMQNMHFNYHSEGLLAARAN